MKVSNPDKPIFEEDGFTKADLVRHYECVGPKMLEYLADRPLTLQRFPNGISSKGFMQKNASKHFPETIARYEVPKQDDGVTTYPVVTRAEDIAYLANQGTITFHMWLSTRSDPDHPDWLVMDLDPESGDIGGVRAAAHAVRGLLGEFGLDGSPMATGSSGFHVWVPLAPGTDASDVAQSARALAGLAAVRHPDELTIEFLKKNRRGRVFMDWLRNHVGSTVVVPFSLRPRAGAPAAVPVTWDEVDRVEPDRWSLDDMGDRLEVDMAVRPQELPVARIVEVAIGEGVDMETPFDRFGRS